MARQGDEPGGGGETAPDDVPKMKFKKPFRFQILRGEPDEAGMVQCIAQEGTAFLRLDDDMRTHILQRPWPVKLPEEELVREFEPDEVVVEEPDEPTTD